MPRKAAFQMRMVEVADDCGGDGLATTTGC
jgi:hypothetical protein